MYSFGLDELKGDLRREVDKMRRVRGGYIKRAIYTDVIAQIDKILDDDKKQEIWDEAADALQGLTVKGSIEAAVQFCKEFLELQNKYGFGVTRDYYGDEAFLSSDVQCIVALDAEAINNAVFPAFDGYRGGRFKMKRDLTTEEWEEQEVRRKKSHAALEAYFADRKAHLELVEKAMKDAGYKG